ncbi:hypothetical protein [Halobacterium wangiae]|uniref:hypothetical protein n=1 Tax=Halobacterium wangiae TaxID=2902623 RepID=UPI001E392593|nr:hypothetical protein [Halobacterium wangiae]
MTRFGLAVLGGVLAQATLLVAVSGMPPHHPTTATTALRVVAIGGIGGFVAAMATDRAPLQAGVATGAIVGVGVGTVFWWALFYADTVGVFHHLHYALATSGVPDEFVVGIPRVIAAVASLLVALAFAVGGLLGSLVVLGRRH